ncbi:MAG: hypothetical protein H8D80_00685 [Proteobacteria bacterium]|nr:hypothetical protein [Pseudomonadota bacterium]
MPRENPAGVSGDEIGINSYYETAANRQPVTDNYLNNNSFKFSIEKTPNVTYFCQKANIPALSFGFVEQPTKYGTRLQLAGTQYDFETLEISFMVDENLKNYMEIFDWMRSMGNVEDFSEYVDITRHQTDATLLVLSSAYRPIYSVNFVGVFPITLGAIDFDSSVPETEPVIVTTTFQYRSFDIVPV